MTRQWMKYSLMVQMAVAGVAIGAEGMDPAMPKDQTMRTGDVKPMPTGALRASKLIGSEVYSSQDKRLASIKDIVLDQNDRKVGYVVLSYGGTMGIGDKLCAVPYNMIQTSAAEAHTKIHANFDEQTLKSAPTFEKDQWPTQANAANAMYFDKADQYYSSRTSGEKAVAADQDAKGITAGAPADKTGLQWTRRVSELIDSNVESPTGQGLGEVKDVVLESNSGKVRYVVLSFGGIMGMGDKLFAVPIDQFKIQPKDNKLVLDISKETLKNAPGFDKNQWPSMTQADWDKDINQFYQQNGINRDMNRNPVDRIPDENP